MTLYCRMSEHAELYLYGHLMVLVFPDGHYVVNRIQARMRDSIIGQVNYEYWLS